VRTVIKRRYLKGRLWKITEKLIPIGRHPFNRKDGFRFVKHYERRNAIGETFDYVRGSVQDGARGMVL